MPWQAHSDTTPVTNLDTVLELGLHRQDVIPEAGHLPAVRLGQLLLPPLGVLPQPLELLLSLTLLLLVLPTRRARTRKLRPPTISRPSTDASNGGPWCFGMF
jgi:hypothetical protein